MADLDFSYLQYYSAALKYENPLKYPIELNQRTQIGDSLHCKKKRAEECWLYAIFVFTLTGIENLKLYL